MQCEKCLHENPAAVEFCAECGTRLPVPPRVQADAARGLPPRWIAATIVGVLCALPIGWLLATAALLPFYLGIFFFALFGLILGAVMFRIGLPAAPIAKPALYVGGALVIVVAWVLAMCVEYQHLYPDAVRFVKESHRSLTAEQITQIEIDTPARVREGLVLQGSRRGGVIGYMCWAARSGRMPVATTPHGHPIVFELRQRPLGWVIRVVVSIALLTFGVLSQISALSAPTPVPEKEEAPAQDAPDART